MAKEVYELYYRGFRRPTKGIVEVSKFFKEEGISKVLDLGFGNGKNYIYLAGTGFNVCGLDWSRQGARMAKDGLKHNGLKARLVVGDMFKPLPYRDGQFDAVIAVRSMYHGRLSQLKKVIKEVARVTRKEGYLYWRVAGFKNLKYMRDELKAPLKKLEPNTYIVTGGQFEGNIRHYFSKKAAMDFLRPYYRIKNAKSRLGPMGFERRDFDILAQRK